MILKIYNQFLCSSMMLPEHKEALNDHYVEEEHREEQCMPEIDEQQLEIWEYLIRKSLIKSKKLNITYLTKKGRRITVNGVKVKYIKGSSLCIKDGVTDKTKAIDLNKIVSIEES